MSHTPSEDSVQQWLVGKLPEAGLGAKSESVFRYLLGHPGEASHAPASDIAAAAGASVASVTRTAQRLGYEGWPHLQRELRARYIARLSLAEIAAEHGVVGVRPFHDSLAADIEALAAVSRLVDEEQIGRVARAASAAGTIFVAAHGSYASIGLAMVHNMRIAGYPVRDLLDRPDLAANVLSGARPGDVLFVCSYWRIYDSAVTAARWAKKLGATVVVISDNLPVALRDVADEAILVPAEGTSFFASLTAAMAVQQGIVATLATFDPQRTTDSIERTERSWQEFRLLHHTVPERA